MKLMTKTVAAKLPKLYSTEKIPAEDKVLAVKFFDPCGRGTWYVVEFDGDDTCFGFIVSPLGPDCDEWGNFSLSELQSVKNRMGLGLERDLWFTPVKFKELS